mgnify:CR=1 FL=1
MFKKIIPILFVLSLLTAGCGMLSGTQTGPIEITDSTGQTAIFNTLPERIAIAGKATVMVQDTIFLFEEASERVNAIENRRQSAYNFLPVVDPQFESKEFFEMNAGAEQVAAVQPDLVLMKNFMAGDLGEPLQQLDIPVLYLDLETPEAFYQDVRMLGEVFGNQERSEDILNYYQARVDLVESIAEDVSQIPDVLLLRYSSDGGEVAFSVPPVAWLQTEMVRLAGGNPVWAEGEFSGGWTVITLEQVAAYDPDQIFLIDYQGEAGQLTASLAQDPIWKEFKAVQNDQLFAFAYDFYSWDQPDTRWILGLEWLATKINPDAAAEIDILEEVETFYREMYRLTESEIETEVLPKLKGDLP